MKLALVFEKQVHSCRLAIYHQSLFHAATVLFRIPNDLDEMIRDTKLLCTHNRLLALLLEKHRLKDNALPGKKGSACDIQHRIMHCLFLCFRKQEYSVLTVHLPFPGHGRYQWIELDQAKTEPLSQSLR